MNDSKSDTDALTDEQANKKRAILADVAHDFVPRRTLYRRGLCMECGMIEKAPCHTAQLDSEMIATPIVSIDPKMLPVHREQTLAAYRLRRRIVRQRMRLALLPDFDSRVGQPNLANEELIQQWHFRWAAWFADLSPEDARALAVALIRSEI